MDSKWDEISQRMVAGLNVQPGELVEVRDDAGRFDLLLSTLLAIEKRGATPLVQLIPASYKERLWAEAPLDYLKTWDHHRKGWLEQIDRVLVLGSAPPRLQGITEEALQAWRSATHRLTRLEEDRQLPYLLAAIPTQRKADQMRLMLSDLESAVLPALTDNLAETQGRINRVLKALQDGENIKIQTGVDNEYELNMRVAGRTWLSDDGCIDELDRQQGAIVSNLPTGAVYTTVIEGSTQGRIQLPVMEYFGPVVLTFEKGRIVNIEAEAFYELLTPPGEQIKERDGERYLNNMLDQHTGEPRRIGHIGIGLNPKLNKPIGWTLVDHVILGCIWISLGENRYMGGSNESSLNVDYPLFYGVMTVDDKVIVSNANLVV
jgi:leucyl aminopeptidase (aminopeptidase T)